MTDTQTTVDKQRHAREAKAALKKLTPSMRAEVVNSMVNNQVRGFFDFLREQSVVGLAIGLVLGTQAKQLVDQMVSSFLNPLVGLLLPGNGTLAQKIAIVHLWGKKATFGWGAFVVSLITFIIVAAVVFYVFKGLRLDKLDKKKE